MISAELDRKLQEAYAAYLQKVKNNPVLYAWDFQEWLDNSRVAARIVEEGWTQ